MRRTRLVAGESIGSQLLAARCLQVGTAAGRKGEDGEYEENPAGSRGEHRLTAVSCTLFAPLVRNCFWAVGGHCCWQEGGGLGV